VTKLSRGCPVVAGAALQISLAIVIGAEAEAGAGVGWTRAFREGASVSRLAPSVLFWDPAKIAKAAVSIHFAGLRDSVLIRVRSHRSEVRDLSPILEPSVFIILLALGDDFLQSLYSFA